jgi:hypothetical protein
MTKEYVLSDVAVKKVYAFFTAAAFLCVLMLLFTRIHP